MLLRRQTVARTRQTRQKKLILEAIEKAEAPQTAEQVLSNAREALPSMALTTVYRNLEQLTDQQIISRLIYPDGITRYRMADEIHHHQLVCIRCNDQVDISQCPLDCLAKQIEDDTGYSITSHTLTLYGLCPKCSRHSKE